MNRFDIDWQYQEHMDKPDGKYVLFADVEGLASYAAAVTGLVRAFRQHVANSEPNGFTAALLREIDGILAKDPSPSRPTTIPQAEVDVLADMKEEIERPGYVSIDALVAEREAEPGGKEAMDRARRDMVERLAAKHGLRVVPIGDEERQDG